MALKDLRHIKKLREDALELIEASLAECETKGDYSYMIGLLDMAYKLGAIDMNGRAAYNEAAAAKVNNKGRA